MKKTAFYAKHVAFGGKIVEFAGHQMPVEFTGINDEHITVREKVGVFDVSHMGEVMVTGDNALAFIQSVTSNNAAKLADNQAQYSCLPNNDGGIVDDVLVYRFNETKYMLVINASNIEKDWNWLVENNSVGAELENISDNIAQLAIQGPLAIATMQKLTGVDLSEIKYYHFREGDFAGVSDVIISATGYTGSGGFELYIKNEDAAKVWDAIFEAGEEFGIKPIGLGARDTLRLEVGFCLYGNDINDTTSPIEAGLGWITKFVEGKEFTNKAYHKNLKDNGVTRKLVGFEMIDRGIPRHDYEIANAEGDVIGVVTSGTMSPCLKVGIGMGYVPTEMTKVDSEVFIKVRKRLLKAKVVRLPFYKVN